MEYTDKEYCLEVWGDWACFTRPELKVERVSYDVMTPSAARAIFEAILFKRYAMRWQVTRGRVKTPNINNKKLVVRSCVDVQRVFVFLRKRAL